MAINFPNSPIDGETYTVNNITYMYDLTLGAWVIRTDVVNIATLNVYTGVITSGTMNVVPTVSQAFDKANAALPNISGTSFAGTLNFPTGNIGIGTTTPDTRLEVRGTLRVRNESGDSNANVYITDGATSMIMGVYPSEGVIGTVTADALFIRTSDVDRVRIGSTGGMTSYGSYEISINSGSADFYLNSVGGTGRRWLVSSSTGGNYNVYDSTSSNTRMSLSPSGTARFYAANGNTTHAISYDNLGGYMHLYDDAGVAASRFQQHINSTRLLELIDGSDMIIGLASTATTGNIMLMRAGYNEAMRIDTGGNVGIGTASPTYKVDVSGNVNSAGMLVNGNRIPRQLLAQTSLTSQQTVYVTGLPTNFERLIIRVQDITTNASCNIMVSYGGSNNTTMNTSFITIFGGLGGTNKWSDIVTIENTSVQGGKNLRSSQWTWNNNGNILPVNSFAIRPQLSTGEPSPNFTNGTLYIYGENYGA